MTVTMRALVLAACVGCSVVAGCSSPIVGSDAGHDAPAAIDAGPGDAGLGEDAGVETDAGPPGPVRAVGGFGGLAGGASTGGTIIAVGSLGGARACAPDLSVCVVGGFSR